MAYLNTGTQRTLSISVAKHGDDNSNTTLLLDGKLEFGAYAAITAEAMQQLSEEAFDARVAAWKIYLQDFYTISEPNLYNNILSSFKYLKGVVVRLIGVGVKQYKITTYPLLVQEIVTVKLEDPFDNLNYTLTIPIGSHSSNICTFSNDSNTDDRGIVDIMGLLVLQTPEFGTYIHYMLLYDLGVGIIPQYPIPV